MTSTLRKVAVISSVLGCCASAHANYVTTTNGTMTTFYGDRNDGSINGPSGDVSKAHTAFLSLIDVAGTESFSSLTGTQPFTSAGLGATIGCLRKGDGDVVPDLATCQLASGASSGRYDTTGTAVGAYLVNNQNMKGDSSTADTGAIVVTFDSAVHAFGFFGTDIGDFGGTFSIVLTDVQGNQTTLDLVSGAALDNSSLLFFGFVDSKNSYKSVMFTNLYPPTQANDGFGLDDFVVGTLADVPPNPTPEPLTALLVLAGLGAAGAARRARR